MSSEEIIEKYKIRVRELETQLSELKFELKETKSLFAEEIEKQKFYQLIADFTFGWELWFEPSGKIKYCSPSCFDLTGYTSNQIIASESIAELLVYQIDRDKYAEFLSQSLDQMLVNQSMEFRILTRTKQLRWCIINVRGVYDKQGKYLGIRASIQDITRLKRAMGQIQEMEAVKELEDRTRQRLQTQLSFKDRELVSFLLQLSQKNELISKVANQLKTLKSGATEKNMKQLLQLLELIEVNVATPLDWSMVESQLEKIHPGFFNRLQAKHPTISVKDKKLCSYLRLGLTSKEISGLQNITTKSVEISRIRLKKKLKLSEKTRIVNYLSQL
jgi:PAS domain S-box-containing protein